MCQMHPNSDVELWNQFLIINSDSTHQKWIKFAFIVTCSSSMIFGHCELILNIPGLNKIEQYTIQFFQRIDKVSDEGEFSLAKFSSSCQLSDDTQLVKKRLFEESFSENLLKLQVSMLSYFKQTCLFSLILS